MDYKEALEKQNEDYSRLRSLYLDTGPRTDALLKFIGEQLSDILFELRMVRNKMKF